MGRFIPIKAVVVAVVVNVNDGVHWGGVVVVTVVNLAFLVVVVVVGAKAKDADTQQQDKSRRIEPFILASPL
jgi:hypothetical protein